MRKRQEPKPRDDRDAAKDIAKYLAEIAFHLGQLKGDANAYLTDSNYDRLKLRLENALSAVEAAAIGCLKETSWVPWRFHSTPER